MPFRQANSACYQYTLGWQMNMACCNNTGKVEMGAAEKACRDAASCS